MDKEINELIEISVKELMDKGYTEEQALRILLITVSKNYIDKVDEVKTWKKLN